METLAITYTPRGPRSQVVAWRADLLEAGVDIAYPGVSRHVVELEGGWCIGVLVSHEFDADVEPEALLTYLAGQVDAMRTQTTIATLDDVATMAVVQSGA